MKRGAFLKCGAFWCDLGNAEIKRKYAPRFRFHQKHATPMKCGAFLKRGAFLSDKSRNGSYTVDGAKPPSKREITARFRQRMCDVHPDHGGASHEAARAMSDLAEARRVLSLPSD